MKKKYADVVDEFVREYKSMSKLREIAQSRQFYCGVDFTRRSD
jgi:hypothetical protein